MKTFLFDNDGTLLNSEVLYYQSWQEVGKKYGFTFDRKEKKHINGKNFEETTNIISRSYGFDMETAHQINVEMNQIRSRLIQNHAGSLYKPHTIELLTYLKDKGYQIAMATASGHARLEVLYQREEVDIRPLFDVIVTGDDVKEGKPNPHIFLAAMEKLGAKPEDTFVLEDSDTGLLAAKAARAKAVLIVDLDDSQETKDHADLVFDSFATFHQYLMEQGI